MNANQDGLNTAAQLFPDITSLIASYGTIGRISFVLAIVVISHICVRLFRLFVNKILSADVARRWTKIRTLSGLFTSAIVFTLYFSAVGIVLQEFGVSLATYLASASVIGLAIGFGLQGMVQDVVTGLTVILSDLFQVGDLVEISGQTGIVLSITMRFTILLSPLGAQVYIPSRTLTNVIIYPRGYLRCFVDIMLPDDESLSNKMVPTLNVITKNFIKQYPGILRDEIEISPVVYREPGHKYIRLKFRIWPGRNGPLENMYKPEILYNFKLVDKEYQDWMISINYEVSESPVVIHPYRVSSRRQK